MNASIDAITLDGSCEAIHSEVMTGLQNRPKRLPSRLFYDSNGSKLFEAICELPEYYLYRSELKILERHGDAIGTWLGEPSTLIEYGSGAALKTRTLVSAIPCLRSYVPIDISIDALSEGAAALTQRFPFLRVRPTYADYTKAFRLPADLPRPFVGYFSGSTIGNYPPEEAIVLLTQMRETVGDSGRFLVGVDLKKEPKVLHAAYNDRQGITARFNFNILDRINRECNADFALTDFFHYAFYQANLGRMEMHLISRHDREVSVAEETVSFTEGESILTEVSYKYTPREFTELAQRAGFDKARYWTDERHYFAIFGLRV